LAHHQAERLPWLSISVGEYETLLRYTLRVADAMYDEFCGEKGKAQSWDEAAE
jgi:hypothetical protein